MRNRTKFEPHHYFILEMVRVANLNQNIFAKKKKN